MRNPNEGKKKYSIVHWKTGVPEEEGMYIISLTNGRVKVSECILVDTEDCESLVWREFDDEDIAAWCKLSDIEPYKEESE